MNLSTSLAERVLDAFPAGTYALHAFLKLVDIVEDTSIPTAAVECRQQPRLLINPDFIAEHADTPEKLLMLVMHELHHVLLGHTRLFPSTTAVDNLVFDAIINALLCRMFPEAEYVGFFTDFYDEASFPECLLRPPCSWSPDGAAWTVVPGLQGPDRAEAAAVHESLYSETGATYSEIYDVLRRQVSEDLAAATTLIGDHSGHDDSTSGNLEHRAPVLVDIVREIVERWPQPPDPIAGRSMASLLRAERVTPNRQISNRELLRCLLRKVGGLDGTGSRHRASQLMETLVETPIPTIDRRTTVLRSLGTAPLLYRGAIAGRRFTRAGERVHIYVDVSGSTSGFQSALYGAVLDCSELVHRSIHLFSTEVADLTLSALRAGDCRTTGGTDISCVAGHMKVHRVRRAVLLTDGFVGTPRGAVREVLERAELGVALTPGAATRHDLEGVVDAWAELTESGGRA